MKTRQSTRNKMYRLIGQWRSSGQTQRVFCESRGIAYGTFKHWIRKQKEEKLTKVKNPSSRSSLLVPLTVTSDPVVDTVYLEIVYPNGVRLSCPYTVGSDVLKTLITLL